MVPYMLVALAAVVVCAVFFYQTLEMDYAAAHTPQILCGIVVILAIWMVVDVARRKRMADGVQMSEQKKDPTAPYLEPFFKNVNLVRLAVFAISLVIYVYFIESVGYLIMTPTFLLFTLLYLKATSTSKAIMITAAVVVTIYAGFVFLLGLPIPMGVL